MPPDRIAAAFYRGNKRFSVETIAAGEPGPGEVAIRVAYCGICGTDMHIYHGEMDHRAGHNRIVGHEMSGIVHTVGVGVDGIAAGQPVVVRPLDPCGKCPACRAGQSHICHRLQVIGVDRDGAMQDICVVPAHTIHAIPETIPLAHAALIEPAAVACHDVRLSGLRPDEDVVVIGGGPIGVLLAMVAREAGGNVVVSEVNRNRLAIADRLGFATVDPTAADLAATIDARTAGKGADVVFEVSGTQAGVEAMTAVAAVRARIVMVAIHASKPRIDLMQMFLRELQLLGARVYEPEDYEKAIALVASGAVAADALITDVSPLTDVQVAFEALDSSPTAMKTLIRLNGDA